MTCIDKIYSVSALVGSSKCNANCSFCAATRLREEARYDQMMPSTFKAALKLSARYGGWSLSLTSSGEPTCSPEAVSNALKDYHDCAKEGAYFPNVNLFTNGILFGDEKFCEKWLPKWERLGLTSIAVSVHSDVPMCNAEAYGIEIYPSLRRIVENIKSVSNLQCRATVVLNKQYIGTDKSLKCAINYLNEIGINNITCWYNCNADGSYNGYTPSLWNRIKIRRWLKKNAVLCHGHSWGGGVYDYKGTIVRLTDYVTKHNRRKNYVRQLVVFQNGDVNYSWIREGSLCFKQ